MRGSDDDRIGRRSPGAGIGRIGLPAKPLYSTRRIRLRRKGDGGANDIGRHRQEHGRPDPAGLATLIGCLVIGGRLAVITDRDAKRRQGSVRKRISGKMCGIGWITRQRRYLMGKADKQKSDGANDAHQPFLYPVQTTLHASPANQARIVDRADALKLQCDILASQGRDTSSCSEPSKYGCERSEP